MIIVPMQIKKCLTIVAVFPFLAPFSVIKLYQRYQAYMVPFPKNISSDILMLSFRMKFEICELYKI
jgi:hypothetical protein